MSGRSLVPISGSLDLVPYMPEVARLLLGEPNARLSTKTTWRYGNFGSLAIEIEKGVWQNHELSVGGGVLDLINWKLGLNGGGGAAVQWMREHRILPDEDRSRLNGHAAKITALYDYVDENGELVFQVVRKEPKAFSQRRRAVEGDDPAHIDRDGWVWKATGLRQVPYRLPELQEAIGRDQTVFVVEGEKDVNNLWKRNIPATTNRGGAGKWPDDLNDFFRGADVVIVPDNDEPGRKHAAKVGAALNGLAGSVRVLNLPGLAEKGDVSDWLAAGGTAEEFYRLAETIARPFGEISAELPSARMILTTREFVRGFVPPEYVIDGILQRSFVYSFTGQTGTGKTAILLLLAYFKAAGIALGGHEMDRGRVLICAGENPTDARQRWIAMAEHFGFDLDAIEVHWIDGVFDIEELFERVAAEVELNGGYDLVEVDTSAAFFRGEEENNNAQAGNHARTLRRMTTLRGRPAVLVACHPVKRAANDNLLPRGGGAFLAEMDGNFIAAERQGLIEFHWQGKLRGPDFPPVIFQLKSGVTCERLKDHKGRLIQTVVARTLNAEEQAAVESGALKREDEVLVAMLKNPGASLRAIGNALGWGPEPSKVSRVLQPLKLKENGSLVKQERGKWALTDKGTKEAEKLELKVDLLAAARDRS